MNKDWKGIVGSDEIFKKTSTYPWFLLWVISGIALYSSFFLLVFLLIYELIQK